MQPTPIDTVQRTPELIADISLLRRHGRQGRRMVWRARRVSLPIAQPLRLRA